MPYDLFWHGPAEAVEAYREAHEIREERSDYAQWEMGMYVYDAVYTAQYNIPGMHDAPKKPKEYMRKPMMFFSDKPPKYYADPDNVVSIDSARKDIDVNERDSEILATWMTEMVREGNNRRKRKEEREEKYNIDEPLEPIAVMPEVSGDVDNR